MSAQGNRTLALRAWEVVFNQRNLDALHEFYTTDAVWHQPDQDLRGIESVDAGEKIDTNRIS